MEPVKNITPHSPVRKMENVPMEMVVQNIEDIRTVRKNIHEQILDLQNRIDNLIVDITNSDPADTPELVRLSTFQLEFLETNATWMYNLVKDAKDKILEYETKITPKSTTPVVTRPATRLTKPIITGPLTTIPTYSAAPDVIQINFEEIQGEERTKVYAFMNGVWEDVEPDFLLEIDPSIEVMYQGENIGEVGDTFDVLAAKAWDIHTGTEVPTPIVTTTELPVASVFDIGTPKFEDSNMVEINIYLHDSNYEYTGENLKLNIDTNSTLDKLEDFALTKTGEKYIIIDENWEHEDVNVTVEERYRDLIGSGADINIYMLISE